PLPGEVPKGKRKYVAYHVIENYFIVPKVYGDRLRLSTLTVLVCCLAAALVAGVVGVILVLPVVASYPILERIWLQPCVERDTVQKREQIDSAEHPERGCELVGGLGPMVNAGCSAEVA